MARWAMTVLWMVALAAYASILMTADVASACKSKSADREEEEARRAVERRNSASSSPEEATDDETSDDVAVDEDFEDFDLICDNHVPPNRTKRLPDIIIIGARKGGTRALIEFLKLHPLVRSAGPEIHYFDRNYEKGPEWYRDQMVAVEDAQLSAEKTPGYFHDPAVPERVKETVPSAKLLLIVRDPVKRLVSDYNQFRTRNLDRGDDYPPLEELVFTPAGDVDESYPPLRRSLYHLHLARWLETIPREQMHVVHGDRFIAEPWSELQKVETFLELPAHITRDNFYFNSTKGFYCAQQSRSKGVWECTMRKCLSKSKGRPKPKLEEETTDKLAEFYREHNEIFNQMVGMDFGWN